MVLTLVVLIKFNSIANLLLWKKSAKSRIEPASVGSENKNANRCAMPLPLLVKCNTLTEKINFKKFQS